MLVLSKWIVLPNTNPLVWQSSGSPCGHAIAIILHRKEDPQAYVQPFFTIAAYKKSYEHPIFPLELANINGDAILLKIVDGTFDGWVLSISRR